MDQERRRRRYIVIGQALVILFALLIASSAYPGASKKPSQGGYENVVPVAYVNVTLTNNQSLPSFPNFDQRIVVNWSKYSSYLNANVSNVRFYSSANLSPESELYAWLETNCSRMSNFSTVWVNLTTTTVPARGNATVYMAFLEKNESWSSHWGISPILSSPYAFHDNGENVFPHYWNFAGSKMPTGWESYMSSGSFSVDNGLTMNGGNYFGNSGNDIYTSQIWGSNTVFDVYGDIASSPITDRWGDTQMGWGTGTRTGVQLDSGPAYLLIQYEGAPGQRPISSEGYPRSSFGGTRILGDLPVVSHNFPAGVWTYVLEPNALLSYYNYSVPGGSYVGTSNPGEMPFAMTISGYESIYAPNGETFNWVRERILPPSNVMPSYIFNKQLVDLRAHATSATFSCHSIFEIKWSQLGIHPVSSAPSSESRLLLRFDSTQVR